MLQSVLYYWNMMENVCRIFEIQNYAEFSVQYSKLTLVLLERINWNKILK